MVSSKIQGIRSPMQTIDTLRDLSDQVLERIKESYPSGIKVIHQTTASRTGLALLSLVSKTGFLSNAIFDLAETDNVYCVNILFRSLIEHYLKSQYLLTRYFSEKSDAVGEEYFEFCDLIEQADDPTPIYRSRCYIAFGWVKGGEDG